MIERKCPSCGTWNGGDDFCKSCGEALSYKEIRKKEVKKLKKEEAEKPPTKLDIWIEKGKNHKYFAVRAMFWVLFSIWFTFMGIGSFFTWLVAWAVG